MRIVVILLFSFGVHSLLSQNINCASAIPINSFDSIEVVLSTEPSDQDIAAIASFCPEFEYSVFSFFNAWFVFDFVSEGDFLFTIKANDTQDVDFVVFTSLGGCTDLEAIRCMQSGPMFFGPGMSDGACLGPTGLSQESVDEYETPGCSQGSDNFLAPIQVDTSLTYYLAISDFGQDSTTSICFSGSARLGNSTSIREEEVRNVYKVHAYDNQLLVRGPDRNRLDVVFLTLTGKRVLHLEEVEVNRPIQLSDDLRGLFLIQVLADKRPVHSDKVYLGH